MPVTGVLYVDYIQLDETKTELIWFGSRNVFLLHLILHTSPLHNTHLKLVCFTNTFSPRLSGSIRTAFKDLGRDFLTCLLYTSDAADE